MNTIQKLTKYCLREDCNIHTGSQTMTCIGWSPSYDKNGNSVGRDPNISTTSYSCYTCGKKWTVRSSGLMNQVEIEEH